MSGAKSNIRHRVVKSVVQTLAQFTANNAQIQRSFCGLSVRSALLALNTKPSRNTDGRGEGFQTSGNPVATQEFVHLTDAYKSRVETMT